MDYEVIELLNDIKSLILGKEGKKWMNISEVSNYTSMSSSTIRRAIKKGVLKVSRSTGKLLFKTEWVDKWLNG